MHLPLTLRIASCLSRLQCGVHVNRPPYYVNSSSAKDKPASK